MVLGPPWAPPVSRYVFREVSGTLLSSILGDFWGPFGLPAEPLFQLFWERFSGKFLDPRHKSLLNVLGSILAQFWEHFSACLEDPGKGENCTPA